MEAYSLSLRSVPVAIGGLVGNVFPPGDGRFVGGCIGFGHLDTTERRYVGGLVGHASHPGPRQFVGGCIGFARLAPYHALPGSRPQGRVHRKAHARRGEEALEGAPA